MPAKLKVAGAQTKDAEAVGEREIDVLVEGVAVGLSLVEQEVEMLALDDELSLIEWELEELALDDGLVEALDVGVEFGTYEQFPATGSHVAPVSAP